MVSINDYMKEEAEAFTNNQEDNKTSANFTGVFNTFNVARVRFLSGSVTKLYSYRIPDYLDVKVDDHVVVSKNGINDINETVCKVVGVIDALEDTYSQLRAGKRYEQVIAVIDTTDIIERRKREERRERLLDLLTTELNYTENNSTVLLSQLDQFVGKSPLIDSLIAAIKANG